jgi:hypothetical protein
MWVYVLSLFIIYGFALFFLVSEIFPGHTFTWLALFSYEAGNRFKKFHFFFALYSIFTYPIALFINAFIFVRELLRTGKISFFHLVLILLTVALHIHYTSSHPGAGSFIEKGFRHFSLNTTVHFYLVMLALFFGVKQFQKYQFWAIAAAGIAYYIFSHAFAYWQFFTARTPGLIIVIIVQTLYVFTGEKYFTASHQRLKAFSVMTLILISYQSVRLEDWFNKVSSIIEKEKGTIPFEKARYLAKPYTFFNPDDTRMQTLSMILMKSNHVSALIDPKHKSGIDLICNWDKDLFLKKMQERNITFDDTIKLGCDFPWYKL